MDLSSLLSGLRQARGYRNLLEEVRDGAGLSASLGLLRAARPPVTAALAQDLDRPIVFLIGRHDRMLTLLEELPCWAPGLRVMAFPDPAPLFYERAAWGPRTIQQRLSVLAALTETREPGSPTPAAGPGSMLILAPARAAMTRTIPPQEFTAHSRWLRAGSSVRLDQLLGLLVGVGYQPASLVTEPGEFSHRGGILDVWPPAETRPVRIELFGDDIESLRQFDPASQRSVETVPHVRITPAREALPALVREEWQDLLPEEAGTGRGGSSHYLEFLLPWMFPSPAGLMDYLGRSSVVLHDDRALFEDTVSELEEQALAQREEQIGLGQLPHDAPVPYLTSPELGETGSQVPVLDLGLMSGQVPNDVTLAQDFSPGPRLGGQLQPLLNHLAERTYAHETVVVVSRQAPRLSELWSNQGPARPMVERVPDMLLPGDLVFVHGALSEGWIFSAEGQTRLHLMTDAEIFGWAKPRPRPRPVIRAAAPESAYADLRPGDFVVHVSHGIGIFRELVDRTLEGIPREFLLLEYADGDQLYVPIHQADHITRYVGVEGSSPALSRLGTQEWDRIKSRVREGVQEIARDLVDLYARRMMIKGHAFSPDSSWQRELEASFPYSETDDQLHAIESAKMDMELDRPMDRLICGDVGYGKTEVALRAAFKAVMDSKQVALLVPTTVLAQQHFNTFRQRLAPFPVEVEMLSRFRTQAEVEGILRRLSGGEIDIIIGTHRLLQKDVRFKDLGLLVIDEEQRFGVTHKEHLKKMRTEVDVLTMTATPIPRTLYMALTGARDISNINTPPEERLPIITHVGPYDSRLVRQAVLRELDRGGQIFFVHNRVQSIDLVHRRLAELVPEARIEVAHGQMPERQLADVMERFTAGEVDVLLSTSIIESGLDIPNANTLIVDRSELFGLAQLYQLRGRVGRGASRAYAYFFRHHRYRPSEEALQRLEILAEHSQLGAGYSIAMRDLEMRGAGDILGTRQHGLISAVGFHLYTRLLTAEVRRQKGQAQRQVPGLDALQIAPEPLTTSIDLPLPSTIPSDYVANRDLRLQLYRRMAELRSHKEVGQLETELTDRFGPPPPEVGNLLYQLKVRMLATQAGIESVSTENAKILIRFPESQAPEDLPEFGPHTRWSKRGLWLDRLDNPGWEERLAEILSALAGFRSGISGSGPAEGNVSTLAS